MKGTERGWDSVLNTATRKIVLCYDRSDKKDWMFSLESAVRRDKTYEPLQMRPLEEICVRDTLLNVNFVINFYCTNQWSWSERARGLVYDEVIVTRRGLDWMEYPENLSNVMSRCNKSEYIPGMAMFLLTQNDQKVIEALGSDTGMTTTSVGTSSGSMSQDFDFPTSLFRRSMLGYFEDIKKPTREEFLFALTMEGISGNTEREKKAIEEAQLHI